MQYLDILAAQRHACTQVKNPCIRLVPLDFLTGDKVVIKREGTGTMRYGSINILICYIITCFYNDIKILDL